MYETHWGLLHTHTHTHTQTHGILQSSWTKGVPNLHRYYNSDVMGIPPVWWVPNSLFTVNITILMAALIRGITGIHSIYSTTLQLYSWISKWRQLFFLGFSSVTTHHDVCVVMFHGTILQAVNQVNNTHYCVWLHLFTAWRRVVCCKWNTHTSMWWYIT